MKRQTLIQVIRLYRDLAFFSEGSHQSCGAAARLPPMPTRKRYGSVLFGDGARLRI